MKIKLAIVLAVLIYTTTYAQISFETNLITDNSNYGSGISGTDAADLDGDGDLDLITYYYEGNFVWYENKPSEGGLVEPKIIYESLNGSSANVFAIDIDNDGDLDVFASSGYDIFWFENLDGLGNFGNQNIITTQVEYVVSLDYHDLDGDGDLDILSSSLYDEKVVWFENTNGLGSFGPEQLVFDSPYNTVVYIFTEDMDGDGDGDIILNSNHLIWLENVGGTFSTEHLIIATRHNYYFPVDLDSDGDIDMVIPEGYDDDLIWYENYGTGIFSGERMIDSTINGDVDLAFAGDIDGDGDVDIIVDGTGLYYYINDGNENFSGGQNIYVNGTNSSYGINAADIDGDGDMDILSDGFNDGNVGIMYSEYDQIVNNFKPERVLCEHISQPIGAFTADMDSDGDLDILIASRGDNKISWFEDINGAQNFGTQHIISTTVYDPSYITATDIDFDGDMDVFVTSKIDDKIIWFRNQGNGSFDDEIVITNSTNAPYMIDIVDMDNDGDLDVLSASYADDKIAWYENTDGLGNFGSQQIISTDSDGPISVYAGDIDGDGNEDVVVTSINDFQRLSWYKNIDGNGNFGPKQVISSGWTTVNSLDIKDIDNDGDLDILASSAAGNYDLTWFRNDDGNGQFVGQQIHFSGSFLVSLDDMDNDGDLDAVAAIGDDIVWHENLDGLGDFSSSRRHIMDNRFDKFFVTADVDFDGDIDVISTREDNDQLAYSKNLGVLGNEISGTVQIDLNNDGCNDLDPVYPNIMVVATNGSTTFGTFTMTNGTYQIPVNTGNFNTTIQGIPAYYTPNPLSYDFNYSGIGNTDVANFCLQTNQSINDVNIRIFPLSQARPGFDATYRIVYNNVGTEIVSGNINFQYNSAMLNFLSASESVASQTANSIIFNYTDLATYESRTIDINFNIFPPPTVNIDEILNFEATINPVSGDFTEEDNYFSFEQIVIGSYDPNDIICLEGDEILIEDIDGYLHYIIRFQNTGTAEAINIRVDNTLDEKLDWETLQVETTSHTSRVVIEDGSELSFIFSGINLPDSTSDEPNSHGYIAYKIKPKPNVVIGDIINNTAAIYFDFNEPIITNTAITEIVEALSNEEFYNSEFVVYPNPTADALYIQSKYQVSLIEIYNSLGQQIMIIKDTNKADVSNLKEGIYYLSVRSSNGKEDTLRFIKSFR